MDFIVFLLVIGGIVGVGYWKRAELQAWFDNK